MLSNRIADWPLFLPGRFDQDALNRNCDGPGVQVRQNGSNHFARRVS